MPVRFRKEALEHLQSRWAGKALLLSGWPSWITVMLTAAFIIALILSLLFTSYTRRINVSGEIITEPRTVTLFSPEQGVISELLVDNGQTVSSGTPLYTLDVSHVARSGNVTTATLAAIEKQQRQLDAIVDQLQKTKLESLKNLQQQIDQYEQAQRGLQGMVSSALEGLRAMQRSRNSYEASMRNGLINSDQLNNQRYLYFQQQSVYQNLNAQAIQQGLQITNLRSELVTKAAEIDNQISQSRLQRDDLSRQLAEADAKGTRLITAPGAGRVTSLSVTPGQMVNAGDSLIQLVPASRFEFFLIIWVPDDSRPYINPGDTINIRYAAFPYEKYGQFPGRIVSVSSAPASSRELEGYSSAPRGPNGAVSGALYKTIVALDNASLNWRNQPLSFSSGMLAQSTLFLEKRPLYQWMLSPYYSLKRSITGPVNE